MANITMNAKDSISAKLAECFVTIGKNRYNFMQAISKRNLKEQKRKCLFLVKQEQVTSQPDGRVQALLHSITIPLFLEK